MTLKELNLIFSSMQEKFGSKSKNAVFGGGKTKNPKYFLVFVNPTARNIATDKNWLGIKCQWLGTKQVWKFLSLVGLFDYDLNNKIQNLKPKDWTYDFCNEVYKNVEKNDVYITNLAKCTQDSAKPLPDKIFKQYVNLLYEEIKIINPENIILFGNQVSSIVLNKKISVSNYRKKFEILTLDNLIFRCFPVFYPVGNGSFNVSKSIEDLQYIIDNYNN